MQSAAMLGSQSRSRSRMGGGYPTPGQGSWGYLSTNPQQSWISWGLLQGRWFPDTLGLFHPRRIWRPERVLEQHSVRAGSWKLGHVPSSRKSGGIQTGQWQHLWRSFISVALLMSLGPGAQVYGCKFWAHCWLAQWPWRSHLSYFHFLHWRTEMTAVPTSRGCCRNETRKQKWLTDSVLLRQLWLLQW